MARAQSKSLWKERQNEQDREAECSCFHSHMHASWTEESGTGRAPSTLRSPAVLPGHFRPSVREGSGQPRGASERGRLRRRGSAEHGRARDLPQRGTSQLMTKLQSVVKSPSEDIQTDLQIRPVLLLGYKTTLSGLRATLGAQPRQLAPLCGSVGTPDVPRACASLALDLLSAGKAPSST